MRTIHIPGDCIIRGWGLGIAADAVPVSNPLYPFRSVWSIANELLEENGAPARAAWFSLPSPTWPGGAGVVSYRVGLDAQPGDFVLFQDAGNHNSDPDAYQAAVEACLDAAAKPGVSVGIMTTFDYSPAPADCQFDLEFNGRTINDAIRAAASARSAPVLDMNAKMDGWRASALSGDGVAVMHPDGIHPNVWGQIRMVGAILAFVGLDGLLSYEGVKAIASANWEALRYGGGDSWSQSRAEAYASLVVAA